MKIMWSNFPMPVILFLRFGLGRGSFECWVYGEEVRPNLQHDIT